MDDSIVRRVNEVKNVTDKKCAIKADTIIKLSRKEMTPKQASSKPIDNQNKAEVGPSKMKPVNCTAPPTKVTKQIKTNPVPLSKTDSSVSFAPTPKQA